MSSDFVKSGFKYAIPELLREYEYQGLGKEQPLTQSSTFETDTERALLQIVARREDFGHNLSEVSSNSTQSIKGGLVKQPYNSSMSIGMQHHQSGSSYMQSGNNQQLMSKPASNSLAAAAAAAQQQQQQYFKPSLVFMTANPKTKESAYAWFRQLAANEPLAKLAKKIPVYNKRSENLPEILITLYEYRVPISRAVWYLKIMVLAGSASLNEVIYTLFIHVKYYRLILLIVSLRVKPIWLEYNPFLLGCKPILLGFLLIN